MHTLIRSYIIVKIRLVRIFCAEFTRFIVIMLGLTTWCKRIDIVLRTGSTFSRSRRACESSYYARVTWILRFPRLEYALTTPALRCFFGTLAPRLFWTCSKFGDALHAHGDCITIYRDRNKIELCFYCVLHVSATLDERGGSVVRSASGVTGV